MKKSLLILICILTIFIFLPNLIRAQTTNFEHVISNSENWQDVYSAMHYANLNKVGSDFLVSTRHGPIILNNVDKGKRIRVITSRDKPYVFNYPDVIKSRGFAGADEIVSDNANLGLIEDLGDINSFIVVGDSYGFNAIAVTPYAVLTNSWVFLANRFNIYQIDNILSKRNIKKIIIYGYVDREVRDVLSKYNPEIIDNQDKFKDNIEIVKRYREINPVKQIALTNGEFIEKELMAGIEPALFTGRDNVPDPIKEYLKNTPEIEVGVLIGNELVGAATNIKRSTGVSVMVKFARGAREVRSGVSAIEGLDLFPIPTPSVKISLYSIKFNKATSQLEVTYKSDSNVPTYIKGTITLITPNERIKVGDIDPIFISPGDFKTIIYSINITRTDNLEAEIYTLFGENPGSLDKILQVKTKVSIIEVIDKCKFNENDVKWLKYNKQKKYFILKIKNSNDVDCWVDLEISDVLIGYIKRTLGIEGSVMIPKGKTKEIMIKEELTQDDIDKNPFVKLILYSGEKEDSLVNILIIDKLELKIERLTILTYLVIIIAIIIVILIIIIFIIKKREDDEED